MRILDDATGSAQAYAGVAFGWLSDVNWMAVGAAVLLISRLIQDVPKAYLDLKDLYQKYKEKKHDKQSE